MGEQKTTLTVKVASQLPDSGITRIFVVPIDLAVTIPVSKSTVAISSSLDSYINVLVALLGIVDMVGSIS